VCQKANKAESLAVILAVAEKAKRGLLLMVLSTAKYEVLVFTRRGGRRL